MEFTIMKKAAASPMKRNSVRAALLLGVWIWAFHGVTRGDDATPRSLQNAPIPEAGVEHFVPHVTPIQCTGTLQMLPSAAISGNDIRVRDVARWSDADSVGFSAIADLIIDHFYDGNTRKLTLDELRSTLSGAGVNLAQVDFAGNRSCVITHSDVPVVTKRPTDEHEMVRQWVEQKPDALPAVAEAKPDATENADAQFHSLRDTLLLDLAQRLNVSADDLQLTFDPKDRSILNLTEPMFHFGLAPRRVVDLGKVGWDVTLNDGRNDRKVTVNAEARGWERQLVVAKAVSYRQVLRDTDFTERRVLVDHLEYDPLLTRSQIVGQQAARDLKPGMVLTSHMVDPVPLVKQGDFVTVTLNSGGVQIRTVATAMESGSFGQTIKVKSEQNQSVYIVTMTGPQEATMGTAPAKDESVAVLK
jgi:flagella basal body P-ring formation protein FlgA